MLVALLTIILLLQYGETVPSVEEMDPYFNPINYEGERYDAQKVIEMLQLRNPEHLDILYRKEVYTPIEFLEAFPTVPDHFQFQIDGVRIRDTVEVSIAQYLPWPHLDYFPLVYHRDKYYSAQTVIELLAKDNFEQLRIKTKTETFSPQSFLLRFPDIPKQFSLIFKNGDYLEDDEIEQYINWRDPPELNQDYLYTILMEIDGQPEELKRVMTYIAAVTNNQHNLEIEVYGQTLTPAEFVSMYYNYDIPDFKIKFKGHELDNDELNYLYSIYFSKNLESLQDLKEPDSKVNSDYGSVNDIATSYAQANLLAAEAVSAFLRKMGATFIKLSEEPDAILGLINGYKTLRVSSVSRKN